MGRRAILIAVLGLGGCTLTLDSKGTEYAGVAVEDATARVALEMGVEGICYTKCGIAMYSSPPKDGKICLNPCDTTDNQVEMAFQVSPPDDATTCAWQPFRVVIADNEIPFQVLTGDAATACSIIGVVVKPVQVCVNEEDLSDELKDGIALGLLKEVPLDVFGTVHVDTPTQKAQDDGFGTGTMNFYLKDLCPK